MEAYYDVKHGLGSAYKFYKSQKKYTYDEIKSMIANQEAYQLNRQGTKVSFFPILGPGPGSYQADLMFPPEVDGYSSILCIINVLTRVAYCYAQKSKADTFGNLKLWLTSNRKSVNFVQTDSGTEFVNKNVKKLFADEGIEFHAVDPKDHTGQGKVERFNGTLRRLITIYMSAYKTRDWVKVLPDLVYNYNHRFHRSLGCAPVDADEATVFDRELGQYDAAQKQFDEFAVGDKVRTLIYKDIFDKGRKEWSASVYKIDEIRGNLIHVANVGWKKHYQLQRIAGVHTKLFDNNEEIDKVAIKKDKKVVRDMRKEDIGAHNKVGLKEVGVVGKRERVLKMDASLIGRRIDRGGGETGKITKYDPDGDYKWYVKYDKKAENDFELMDAAEVRKYIV